MILSYSIVFQFDTTLCRDIFLQKVLFLFRFCVDCKVTKKWLKYCFNITVKILKMS